MDGVDLVDRVFFAEAAARGLAAGFRVLVAGEKAGDHGVVDEAGVLGPARGVEVEIHQQLAEVEQRERDEAAHPPARLGGFDQRADFVEVGFRRGVLVEVGQRHAEVGAQFFAQRQVGQDVFAGVAEGVFVGAGARVEPAALQVHRHEEERREAGGVAAAAFEPLEKAEGEVEDVRAHLLDGGFGGLRQALQLGFEFVRVEQGLDGVVGMAGGEAGSGRFGGVVRVRLREVATCAGGGGKRKRVVGGEAEVPCPFFGAGVVAQPLGFAAFRVGLEIASGDELRFGRLGNRLEAQLVFRQQGLGELVGQFVDHAQAGTAGVAKVDQAVARGEVEQAHAQVFEGLQGFGRGRGLPGCVLNVPGFQRRLIHRCCFRRLCPPAVSVMSAQYSISHPACSLRRKRRAGTGRCVCGRLAGSDG